MCPNIVKDNDNSFHRVFEEFAIEFVFFINQIKSRKEVTFKKEIIRKIIFNMIPNSLNKDMI